MKVNVGRGCGHLTGWNKSWTSGGANRATSRGLGRGGIRAPGPLALVMSLHCASPLSVLSQGLFFWGADEREGAGRALRPSGGL